MRFKLITVNFDRTKYLKEAFWRNFPIIWISEKGRYGFENISSWLNGLLFDFEGFLHGEYRAYTLDDVKQRPKIVFRDVCHFGEIKEWDGVPDSLHSKEKEST